MTRPAAECCVVVTTYSRPDQLARLLDDVEREFPTSVDVRVYDDASPGRDLATEQRLRRHGWSYRRAVTNHGKRGWWRWWNTILEDLQSHPARLVFGLQDDMRLCEDFFARALGLWTSIADPDKASLYLHLSEHRAELGTSCWTPVLSERAGPVVRSGWMDMNAFIAHPRLFDTLGWRLDPVTADRWRGREELSSGVGQQISSRAHAHGLGMYRVEEALVVHDESRSVMNPEARRRWPMTTVRFVDGDDRARSLARARPLVYASLATMRTRERGLQQVVESLLPQVDRLQVYLNGYDHVPRFLESERVEVARSQEHGDRGDAGKFFWAGRNTGYQLACDDDISYPRDYVDRLVAGVERHQRHAVVGFHGSLLPPRVDDYYRSRRLLHFSRPAASDLAVHVLGTGVAGYHSSTLPVRPEDFRSSDMADIWLAVLGQQHRVPFRVLEHRAGWLTELPGFREDSLYVRARRAAQGARPPLNAPTRVIQGQGRWHLFEGVDAERVRRTTPGVPPPPYHLTAVRTAGDHEAGLLDTVRALRVRGVYVDVGAHHGADTTFFALECAADHVIAIEPDPASYAELELSVAENALGSRVTLRRVAVHPRWRAVSLRPVPGRDAAGRTGQARPLLPVGVTRRGDAPAAPLDEILADVEGIGLVKVDAGVQVGDVLMSARGILDRHRPVIAVRAASWSRHAGLRRWLSAMGYVQGARAGRTPSQVWLPTGGKAPVLGRLASVG